MLGGGNTLGAERTEKVSHDKKRQVGTVVLSAEMLNKPIDRENAIFKREYFHYRAFEKLEGRRKRVFLTIDRKGTDAKFDGTD